MNTIRNRTTSRSTTNTTIDTPTPGTLMHDVFTVVNRRKSSFDRETLLDALDRRGAIFADDEAPMRALRRLRADGFVDYSFVDGKYTVSR